MWIFKSKIDRLDEIQNKFERSLENKKSEINYINSKLEAKITKLQEKAYKNRLDLENFKNEIKLRLDRNAAMIRAEAEYAKKLGDKYTTVTKGGK